MLRFGSALPRVRRAVKAAFAGSGVTRTKVIAAVVRLIDRALLRPGHEEYAREGGGRGATTLLKDDVAVEGDKVVLEFEGKGGKQIQREVEDPALARVVRKLGALGGRRLFKAPDGNGAERPITAREVNSFIAKATGINISAKDFRTFRASAAALVFLTKRNGHESSMPAPRRSWPPPTRLVKSCPTRAPSPAQATFTRASSRHTSRES